MSAQVICRSEYQYAQRPIAFTWEDESLPVKEILAGWRTPDGWGFRVETKDGRRFELYYLEAEDVWDISII